MTFMFEVYYKPPVDPAREEELNQQVSGFGGRLDLREVPDPSENMGICLTYEFEGIEQPSKLPRFSGVGTNTWRAPLRMDREDASPTRLHGVIKGRRNGRSSTVIPLGVGASSFPGLLPIRSGGLCLNYLLPHCGNRLQG